GSTLLFCQAILFFELPTIYLLAIEEARIADFFHNDFLQHLADDALDVLIVNVHLLEAIHFLHFTEEELHDSLFTLNLKYVMRTWGTIGDNVASLNQFAVAYHKVAAYGNGVKLFVTIFGCDG